ncbi:MAG: RDD family protein [Cellvibrionaceae bacterium]
MSEITPIPINTTLSPSLIRRFVILNYDSLLLMAVSMAYGLVYIGISKLLFNISTDRATGTLFQLGWLLSIFGFYYYFWTRGGQTTGMRAWRVQIISIKGSNTPTIAQCIIRFCLAAVGWALFVSYFFDNEKCMLHDRWSHTRLLIVEKETKK